MVKGPERGPSLVTRVARPGQFSPVWVLQSAEYSLLIVEKVERP